MEKIRTIIVDDELPARQGVRTLLAADPEIEIIGECGDGGQALKEISARQPDLVLLDIQMPDLNGFEVVEMLNPAHIPALIFVTAYDQYALKAFEFSALDYLLKPFTDERFRQALARAKTQHRQRESSDLSLRLRQLLESYGIGRIGRIGSQAANEATTAPLQRFPVRKADTVYFVPVDEIDWLEADGYCTKLHSGKQTHLVRGNLGSFETQLDPKRFVRIQRSAIVNLSRVQCLKHWFHGACLVRLKDGTELKVSGAQRRRLEQLLEQLA